MEETVREVLYETRFHASRPYTSNYPPLQRNEGGKGNILSRLSSRGVSQLKEKWSEYRHPRRLKKLVSLFISPSGEHVAVASGNVITILQKDDDYQEPSGVFISNSLVAFTCGSWSEAHDIFGVVDDTDTVYFIQANGEEIARITNRDLKVSFPIIGLIAQYDSDVQRSCLCSFNVLTSDGSLHCIEVSQEPSASISSSGTLINSSTLKGQFPKNVFCFDYHPELSLLVVVGSAVSNSLMSSGISGSCCLSLWRKSMNFSLELVFSTQVEGLYSKPKGYVDQLTYPKVLISPKGKFVAAVDLTGCLRVFKLDKENCSLSNFAFPEMSESKLAINMSDEGIKLLSDIFDFTWWSDCILALAKRSGTVTMLDILKCQKLLENDLSHSLPVVERVQQFQGHFFLLESTSSDEQHNASIHSKTADLHHVVLVTEDSYSQLDIAGLRWSLISFSERSVPEMYKILINDQKYQAALDFANRHELDKDEVLKSQWLQSDQGIYEMNTFLSKIRDQFFVLSECIDNVGPKEDDEKALLAFGLHLTNQYKFLEVEDHECSQVWDYRMTRLQLLQFRDRLDTYLGINMGRFSVQEYKKFRVIPIDEVAVTLAESGKIGALNLLFKRHPYSLSQSMLEILAAIPETIPVQSYGQLLPGRSPPTSVGIRESDWVECEEMVSFINKVSENRANNIHIRTEPIVKQCLGYFWPSIDQLSIWYNNRARDIDSLSGQLDNCLCLVDFACRKGIHELQQFHKDISYLNELIYANDTDEETSFNLSLVEWAQLSDYKKFRMMLRGVKEENVIERLCDKAIPFMRTRSDAMTSVSDNQVTTNNFSMDVNPAETFLVKWLKETASGNKLGICLVVIEEGCRDFLYNGIFSSEVEAVDCALQCIYLCTVTDRWNIMASILSKLPQLHDTERCIEELKRRLKLAESHIEAGRLLAFYQVPKPIDFFLEAHSDVKGVKQILRLILSKFSRRQPGRSDNDWANMWRDIQSLQEKAFPFLDLEYMLMEFCRGLLKAGKFSLARNYLKGTGSVPLASEKAEKLVIQAGREYLFSASSLACLEIWKAKECLSLFPSSRCVKVEADIIDALTVRLPSLGVTLLPMQFRQIKDPMEIIKMAVTSQAGAYLHVDELIEIARLLGLSSQDQISAVEEAIARQAAAADDLQLAFDLCLVLAKKGHGLVWDLCAALARGPAIENRNISSRKQLLGFALSHCDDESIGELLKVWKDLDMQGQCETLLSVTGTNSPNLLDQGSLFSSLRVHSTQDIVHLTECSRLVEGFDGLDPEIYFNNIKSVLSEVAKDLPVDNESDWDSFLRENGKILSFAALQLPRLLELSRKAENGKVIPGLVPGKQYVSVRMQAVMTILCWLARNGFAPKDNLVASLAKSIIEPPITKEEDILGCSFLLNLMDAFNGVEIIEEQLKTRQGYPDICSIMNVGMTYSLLHNSSVECEGPTQRRELLLKMFKEKHTVLKSDKIGRIGSVQSTFWREWKLKLEDQKRVADHSRVLKQIIPNVEVARFLSGDLNYIESVISLLTDSVKFEKKCILKDVLKLADTYGLHHTKVLQQYLGSVLASEVWTEEDITAEISNVKEEIAACAAETIKTIYFVIYPVVDGRNKLRLAYIYGLLSDCYLQLKETQELVSMICPEGVTISTVKLAHFYKVLEQECGRVSFIKNLNFKSIAELGGLNLECFSTEVCNHIDKDSLEALAEMVQNLVSIYADRVPEGLILWQDVYKHYVLSLLKTFEGTTRTKINNENLMGLISQLEQTYDLCRTYIRGMPQPDALDIMKQFFTVIIPLNLYSESLPDTSIWQDCLIMLLNFWIRLTDDMQDIANHESSEVKKFELGCFMRCLKVLIRLVTEDSISPREGWGTIFGYLNYWLVGDVADQISIFCRSMILSGCGFGAIADVHSEAVSMCPTLTSNTEENCGVILDLPHLYFSIFDTILQDLVSDSPVHQNLYRLLSTLSKLEGDLEDLRMVRHGVWEMMVKFSDNLHLPNHVRVSVLELMQFISGRNISGFSAELQTNVIPWEGWDELWYTSNIRETTANEGASTFVDNSSRFTSTLVALRSSQLVATISPTVEISPDDLVNVETSVSCFLKLCRAAITEAHCDALIAILEEWEGLFQLRRDEEASTEAADAENNWGNDDWDEGWESFQDEEPVESEKKGVFLGIHPLHSCWLELFKKLVSLAQFKEVMKLIDKSLTKSNGILLDADDLKSLSHIVLGLDCFLALKMVLLLPYEAIQLQCLDAVEDKLKQEGISETIGRDLELLLLVLSSGITSTILTKSSYGTVSSFLCYQIGNFFRQCQEAQVARLKNKGSPEHEKNEGDLLLLFRTIIFPCFTSELVMADQHILAGFLVTKFMHTNPSLSLINVAEANLNQYLKRQLQDLHDDNFTLARTSSSGMLRNTISSLRSKLSNVIPSALSTLTTNIN